MGVFDGNVIVAQMVFCVDERMVLLCSGCLHEASFILTVYEGKGRVDEKLFDEYTQ